MGRLGWPALELQTEPAKCRSASWVVGKDGLLSVLISSAQLCEKVKNKTARLYTSAAQPANLRFQQGCPAHESRRKAEEEGRACPRFVMISSPCQSACPRMLEFLEDPPVREACATLIGGHGHQGGRGCVVRNSQSHLLMASFAKCSPEWSGDRVTRCGDRCWMSSRRPGQG